MKTISVIKPGVVKATEKAIPRTSLENTGRIRVKVKYAGVGFADVVAVEGGYPLAPKRPFSPGYEFFGFVEDMDVRATSSAFAPGERVVGMVPHMGAYREWIDADPRLLTAVPQGVSDEVAALLPLNYLTALALMERSAQLVKGNSFLIHGAAGGVGTAALEIAKVLGLQAFGTASESKHDLVRSLLGVPLERRNGTWRDELLRLKPGGVDAAFDAFGPSSLKASWDVLSPKGTLVCYGLASSIKGGTSEFVKGVLYLAYKKAFGLGRRVAGCRIPKIIETDPDWVQDAMKRIMQWTEDGTFHPVSAGILPWRRVVEAHRELAQGRIRGKLLLDFSCA